MSNFLRLHGILQARISEWVAFPFFTGSSQPRGWTQVSHTAGRFFTSWATREPYRMVKWIQFKLDIFAEIIFKISEALK